MANGGFGVTGDVQADTRHPSIPLAAKGYNFTVFDSTAVTGAQTPLTANYKAGTVIDLGKAGSLALTFKYDANASSTTNQLKFLLFVSNAETAPLITADEWGAISALDATPADAVLTDSMPTDVDMTTSPAWGELVLRPASYTLKAMSAGTHKQRPTLVLDVRRWRFFCLLAKEEGDTTNVGTLVVQGALSA